MEPFPPRMESPDDAEMDAEIVHSIRVIEQQRKTKLVMMLVVLVSALVVGSAAVYFAYQDTPSGTPSEGAL